MGVWQSTFKPENLIVLLLYEDTFWQRPLGNVVLFFGTLLASWPVRGWAILKKFDAEAAYNTPRWCSSVWKNHARNKKTRGARHWPHFSSDRKPAEHTASRESVGKVGYWRARVVEAVNVSVFCSGVSSLLSASMKNEIRSSTLALDSRTTEVFWIWLSCCW